MTLITLNPTANSGYLSSTNATYATARSGSTLASGTNTLRVGQQKSTDYIVLESFLEFSISGIPAGSTINSVSLQIYLALDGSTTDFTAQVRSHDYGTSLTTGDWIPGANLGSDTLLATLASSGVTVNAYNSFTENGSNFVSAITIGGTLRIAISSDRTLSGTAPSSAEYFNFAAPSDATNPAKLVIDYTAPPAVANLSATGTLTASGYVTHFSGASLSATDAITVSGYVTHFGAASLSGTTTLTVAGQVVTDRSGQRSGGLVPASVTLRIHTPQPGAVPLIGLDFATPQTTLALSTSVERGVEACQIGFPNRTSQERGVPGWLPKPVMQYRPMGHITVSDGAGILFAGRANQQPQYIGGDIRAVTAQGYWDALNEREYANSDTTLTTSDAIMQEIITSFLPYATIDLSQWTHLGIQHAPSEFTNQRGGQIVDSLVKEGSALGVPYDLQFWPGQDGKLLVRLVARVAPDRPDYECDWIPDTQVVNVNPDYSQLFSHVRVAYTPAGGSETLTSWQPSLDDTTFWETWGFIRTITLNAGQKSQVGAEQWRDTQQAMLSRLQWAGAINATRQYPLYAAGTRVPVSLRRVRSGQWLRLRPLDDLLQIQKTRWEAMSDSLEMSVSSGLPQRSLQQKIVETTDAVRSRRNPLSGAKAT